MTGNFLIAASSPSFKLGSERSRPVTTGRSRIPDNEATRLGWNTGATRRTGDHEARTRTPAEQLDAVKGKGRDSNPRFHAAACQLKRARAECRPFTPSMSHCQSEEKGHPQGSAHLKKRSLPRRPAPLILPMTITGCPLKRSALASSSLTDHLYLTTHTARPPRRLHG